eukprot:TRINITY_DN2397_c0_g2_i1.p1 TRINITY_DN2397_c0_g2~~TRINITY_DN2397_c0_g2_i1.p1  ORF type:complete len:108 (-),score=7.44 TRINITY_DN2397_c0_g2_i1:71-394(-)
MPPKKFEMMKHVSRKNFKEWSGFWTCKICDCDKNKLCSDSRYPTKKQVETHVNRHTKSDIDSFDKKCQQRLKKVSIPKFKTNSYKKPWYKKYIKSAALKGAYFDYID